MRRCLSARLILSVALVLCLGTGAQAQKIDAGFNPTSGVLPHSPEAGTLIKFVEVPVSPYTGLPEVTIPLATVSEHRLSVPVSLSYHGGGHRVREIANWVGLGWKLNAGGMITRKVRGLPDDAKRGQGFLQFRQQYGYGDLLGWLQAQNEVQFQSLAAGCWDTEPDEYYFELNGISGKFAFDWHGDLPKVSSPEDVKILSFQQGPDRTITEWKLAGPDGVIYTFSALETTEVFSEFSFSAICTSGWQTFVSAWYVSRIEDPQRPAQQILFDYDSYRIEQDWTGFETRAYASANNPASCGGGFSGSSSYAMSRVTINGKRVKNIRAASGHQKLRFDALTLRTDVNTSFANSPDLYRLDDIVLLGASGQTLSSYRLDYTYQGRLMLASIQPRGADGQTTPAYQFAYNPKTLPPVNSKAIDHWGFYNGVNNGTLLPEYVHRLMGNVFVYFPGADRKPKLEFTQAAALEKITYPTGGSVELTYELNEYSYVGAQSVASQQEYVQHPESVALTATGNLGNSNWVEVEKSFSVESMENSVFATVFVNGSTWATFAGHLYLPQAQILRADGTLVASFSLQVGEASQPPPYVQQLPSRYLLLAPGDYKLKAKARKYMSGQGTDSITVQVYWTETELSDPVLRKPAGGLRVKQIRSKDVNGTVASLRTYSYEMDTPAGYSSGVVYGEPLYVYQATSLDGQGNECRYVQLVGASRVALGSTAGSHIGYRRVVERFGAAGEGGSNVTEYTSPFEYTDALNTVKPFKDPTSNSFKTGLMKRQRTYDRLGALVREVGFQYEFIQTDLPNVKVSLGNIAPPAYSGGSFYQAMYLGSAYAAYPFEEKFAFSFSPYRMGFSRVKSTTEMLDGVSKTTTFGYDPAGRHNRPVTVSFKNSDNKMHRTDSKTAHEANVGCLLAENMVAAPVEERSFVDDQLTGGWRVQYGNDGFGGCQPLKYFEILHDGSEVQRAEVLEYDANGNLRRARKSGYPEEKLTWLNGLVTKWEYGSTGAGVVKQMRQYAYFPNSRLLKQLTDIDGQATEFSYDGFQRLKQSKARAGNVVSDIAYQYGNPNRVTTTATATGAPVRVSEQTYDGLGRPLKTTLNGVLKKEIIYDGLGRVWKQTHLPGNFVSFAYDGSPLNRVVEKFFPDGNSVMTDYGAAGAYHLQTVTDENDGSSVTVTDLLGRVVEVRNAQNKSTVQHYDLRGNLVRVVPPMGPGPQYEHLYTYDKRNRMTGKKMPGTDWQSFVYDDSTDLLKKVTDGLGRVLEYDYDTLGRQKAVKLNGATIATTA
jgi:YD repeat-containing protein